MKIGILSTNKNLYSTKRLVEAGKDRGHEILVINHKHCYMNITSHNPSIHLKGEKITGIDAIIPRIGASYTFYGTAVVRQFEMMNVLSANDSMAISRSRDKLRSLQLLAREGLGLPVTSFAHSTKDIEGLMEIVGGTPLLVKLLEGTQGVGVVLAETKSAAKSVVEAFRQLDANILVQQFIKEAKGNDIRAFVVGRRVIAAMERHAAPGEFRSNLHRGGRAEKIKLTPEERETAVNAARTVGLNVAGVDMLQSEQGPLVIEVNSSPGLEGIETASGKDVAGAIIEFLERKKRKKRSRGVSA